MYNFLILPVLLLTILVFFFRKKAYDKKRERGKAIELKRAFNQLSRKHKLSIDEIEVLKSKVIGLDRKNSKFFWIDNTGKSLIQNCISINEIESHRVRKVINKIESCTNEVVMELNFKNQKPSSFVFYDSSKDNASALPLLRDKAKYWNAKIHSHINAYDSRLMFEYA